MVYKFSIFFLMTQKLLYIKATPKSSSNRIKYEKDSDGKEIIRVYVTEAPEDGKANKAIIKLLAKELGVPKSALEIIKGETGRDKIVKFDQ